MGSATARAHLEKPDELKAPLFRLLLNQLDAPRRWIVLDLGAASTPMLDLLSAYRCRVEIADLATHGAIDTINAQAQETFPLEAAVASLPPRGEEPVDVVLCWDMLNYLQPGALSALMQAIAERARPGALAHALIVYSDSSMPAQPGRWLPNAEAYLRNKNEGGTEIRAPRYSPEDLGRHMAPFAIERGMLLANGMQEFLFRLQ